MKELFPQRQQNKKKKLSTCPIYKKRTIENMNDVMATNMLSHTYKYVWMNFSFYLIRMCVHSFIYHNRNPVPYENSMDAKYEELINSHARWFTDGHIAKQKNIQLSLSSQLPLTNEMTFILVFSM